MFYLFFKASVISSRTWPCFFYRFLLFRGRSFTLFFTFNLGVSVSSNCAYLRKRRDPNLYLFCFAYLFYGSVFQPYLFFFYLLRNVLHELTINIINVLRILKIFVFCSPSFIIKRKMTTAAL